MLVVFGVFGFRVGGEEFIGEDGGEVCAAAAEAG